MKQHIPQRLDGASATLDDCVRLWRTLTEDYIPGLTVEVTPIGVEGEPSRVLVELVDYTELEQKVSFNRSVWSRKEFYSPLYLISHTQLFDLLIVGYRTIDEYFRTGVDKRPTALKK